MVPRKEAQPEHPSGDKRFKLLDVTIRQHQGRPDGTVLDEQVRG